MNGFPFSENWNLFVVLNAYFIGMPLFAFLVRIREQKKLMDFLIHVYHDRPRVAQVAGDAVKIIFPKLALAAPLIGALAIVIVLRLMRFFISDSQLFISDISPFAPVVASLLISAGILLCYDIHSLFRPPWSDSELRQQLRRAEFWMRLTNWVPKVGEMTKKKVRNKILESIPDPARDISKRFFIQNALRLSLAASMWQCWYLLKEVA